jgi:hypothetical protein
VILECGGKIGQLPITRLDDDWLTPKDITRKIALEAKVRVYIGDVDHDDEDDVSKSMFKEHFEPSKDVYFIPTLHRKLMAREAFDWPTSRSSYLRTAFEAILRKSWGDFEEDEDSVVTGEVYGDEITRSVRVYTRGGS